VFGWTCLNALCGRWDPVAHQPENDRDGYGRFFERLLSLNAHHRIVDVLQDEKPMVMSIIEDAYLNKHFWHDPDAERGRRPDRWAYKTRSDYVDGRRESYTQRTAPNILWAAEVHRHEHRPAFDR
jgi:hypothetical protein